LAGIFVSYRRSDSQGEAGRLFDDLVQHFGEQTVFMDVSAIEAGRDFRKAIEEGVTKCGVLLVVIGPEWLDAKDERGARRLDDPADFVRIETASALKRDISVIPVLVRGAKMPLAEQLPDDLKDLAYRNCIELTHVRWRSDVKLLTEALRRLVVNTGPIGTITGPAQATASPDARRHEETTLSKPEAQSSAGIDSADIERVSRELALRIGPIAAVVVKRAASACTSVDDLYLKVAEEIDSRDEREEFLKRSPISATAHPAVARATTLASNAPAALPLPRDQANELPHKASPPAIGVRSSSRWKYWLAAGGGGFLLVIALVFAFTPKRGAGSSQTMQVNPPEARLAEPAPAEPSHSAPVTDPPVKSDDTRSDGRKVPQRVHVPQEVSQELLLSKVVPAYPPLARQAHIQGMVIFDADVSREGAVQQLRLISGHPLLVSSALEAVKQWRYKPYVLNGHPTAVRTQIQVNFTLTGG
jgi:TonB family protein